MTLVGGGRDQAAGVGTVTCAVRAVDDHGRELRAAHGPATTAAQRTAAIAIVAVAGLVRIAWVLWATNDPSASIGDPYFYFALGQQLADGAGYLNVVTGDATAYYPVGYPAFLGVVFWLVQHTPVPDELPLAATLVQAVLGTASVALVFLIARRVAGTPAALVAATVTAAFPSLVIYTATLQLETVFIFLALAAVAILVVHDWSEPPSLRRLLAFGIVLGVSALVRPFSLPFVLAPAVALVLAGLGWRQAVRALAVPLGAAAVVLLPWVVRNATVMDAAVISTNTGDTVCLDRHDDATGGFQFADHEGCAPPEWDEARRNERSTELAIRYVLDDPARELRQVVRRARLMFGSDDDGILTLEAGEGNRVFGARARDVVATTSDWYFRGALVLGGLGVVALVAGRGLPGARGARAVTATAALTLLLVPLGLWGSTRFHVPLLPFLAIGAGAALTAGWRSPVRGRAPRDDLRRPADAHP